LRPAVNQSNAAGHHEPINKPNVTRSASANRSSRNQRLASASIYAAVNPIVSGGKWGAGVGMSQRYGVVADQP